MKQANVISDTKISTDIYYVRKRIRKDKEKGYKICQNECGFIKVKNTDTIGKQNNLERYTKTVQNTISFTAKWNYEYFTSVFFSIYNNNVKE